MFKLISHLAFATIFLTIPGISSKPKTSPIDEAAKPKVIRTTVFCIQKRYAFIVLTKPFETKDKTSLLEDLRESAHKCFLETLQDQYKSLFTEINEVFGEPTIPDGEPGTKVILFAAKPLDSSNFKDNDEN